MSCIDQRSMLLERSHRQLDMTSAFAGLSVFANSRHLYHAMLALHDVTLSRGKSKWLGQSQLIDVLFGMCTPSLEPPKRTCGDGTTSVRLIGFADGLWLQTRRGRCLCLLLRHYISSADKHCCGHACLCDHCIRCQPLHDNEYGHDFSLWWCLSLGFQHDL